MITEVEEQKREAERAAPPGRVAQNAVIYFAAQILTWLVTFVTISIIPRRLGEQGMGELSVASTTVSTAVVFLSLGIDPYLIREVGRDRSQTERLLGATLGLRLTMMALLVLLAALLLRALHPSPMVWLLGLTYIVMACLNFCSEPMRSVLAGWEDAKRVSVLDIAGGISALAAIPFLIYGPIAITIPSLFMTILMLGIRYRWVRHHARIRPRFDLRAWKEILSGGLPYVANTLVLQLYTFTTITVLRAFTNDAVVGVYSQASKLFGAFLFVPTALGAALLPSLARLAHAAPGEFRAMQTRVLSLLVVLGLPVMIAVMLLAAPLCHLLYGPDKFTALPPVLQVYALAILPMYIVTTMYQFLVAQGRQLIWSLFLLATVGLYVLFSVLLIPWTLHTLHNGTVGAVGATFLAEMCSAGFALALLGTNLLDWQTLGRIGRALLATAGMGVVLWLTRGLFLLIPLMAGTLTFIVLGGWLHILTPEEHDRLVGMVRRKLRRR